METRLKDLYNVASSVSKCMEKVSENLLLFNIIINSEYNLNSRPIHMRYDFGDFPPLDLSIDSESGWLKEITIFINKKGVTNNLNLENREILSVVGMPCFDISEKGINQYYYDQVCEVDISFSGSKLLACVIGRDMKKKVIINDGLQIFLDEDDLFVGLLVNDLSEEELIFF